MTTVSGRTSTNGALPHKTCEHTATRLPRVGGCRHVASRHAGNQKIMALQNTHPQWRLCGACERRAMRLTSCGSSIRSAHGVRRAHDPPTVDRPSQQTLWGDFLDVGWHAAMHPRAAGIGAVRVGLMWERPIWGARARAWDTLLRSGARHRTRARRLSGLAYLIDVETFLARITVST